MIIGRGLKASSQRSIPSGWMQATALAAARGFIDEPRAADSRWPPVDPPAALNARSTDHFETAPIKPLGTQPDDERIPHLQGRTEVGMAVHDRQGH